MRWAARALRTAAARPPVPGVPLGSRCHGLRTRRARRRAAGVACPVWGDASARHWRRGCLTQPAERDWPVVDVRWPRLGPCICSPRGSKLQPPPALRTARLRRYPRYMPAPCAGGQASGQGSGQEHGLVAGGRQGGACDAHAGRGERQGARAHCTACAAALPPLQPPCPPVGRRCCPAGSLERTDVSANRSPSPPAPILTHSACRPHNTLTCRRSTVPPGRLLVPCPPKIHFQGGHPASPRSLLLPPRSTSRCSPRRSCSRCWTPPTPRRRRLTIRTRRAGSPGRAVAL